MIASAPAIAVGGIGDTSYTRWLYADLKNRFAAKALDF